MVDSETQFTGSSRGGALHRPAGGGGLGVEAHEFLNPFLNFAFFMFELVFHVSCVSHASFFSFKLGVLVLIGISKTGNGKWKNKNIEPIKHQ